MAERRWHVWLHGHHLGEIERLRSGRARLRFDSEALQRWGVGARPLSYSLPLTSRRVESLALETYLVNLLPEGAVRAQLEREYRVHPGDALELLGHIGAECAGAVQITCTDVVATGTPVPLSSHEVDRIVEELPTLTPPPGQQVTASLGGVQSKVLLTRTEQGWAWPADGAISTHLIKPAPSDPGAPIPLIVEYEEWALRLARAAGVPAASATLETFGERQALVIERYDRRGGRRLHQEDAAQALGIRPEDKYEPASSAGRLTALARGPGAEAAVPSRFRAELLRLVVFNVLVGNGDGHAKNYSLMIDDGVFSIAPCYDVAPVYYVNPRFGDAGMRVAGQRQLRYIGGEHLVREAVRWGVDEAEARAMVAETAQGVLQALEAVQPTVHGVELARSVQDAAERVVATGADR